MKFPECPELVWSSLALWDGTSGPHSAGEANESGRGHGTGPGGAARTRGLRPGFRGPKHCAVLSPGGGREAGRGLRGPGLGWGDALAGALVAPS